MGIRKLVLPIIYDALKKVKSERKYGSYDSAAADCITDAYQNTELCDMIADKTVPYIKTLEQKPWVVNGTSVFLPFVLNLCLSKAQNQEIVIVDFGGACGAHFFETIRFLPETAKLKWFVVETEQMVKSARKKGIGEERLNFLHRLEDITHPVDFVYSSGALQYVPDPYGFLDKLASFRANWMLFNRMMFNRTNRDVITVQKSSLSANGPGELPSQYRDRIVTYPHTTLAFERFNSVALKHGYKLDLQFDEASGSFAIPSEDVFGQGVLYKLESC